MQKEKYNYLGDCRCPLCIYISTNVRKLGIILFNAADLSEGRLYTSVCVCSHDKGERVYKHGVCNLFYADEITSGEFFK